MKIKILGVGCSRCRKLESIVRELVSQNNIDAVIEKVSDVQEMMNYGILATPGLVINEKLKSSGIIPKNEQILNWMKEEAK
jgi:small redox-active disulfide protein 2